MLLQHHCKHDDVDLFLWCHSSGHYLETLGKFSCPEVALLCMMMCTVAAYITKGYPLLLQICAISEELLKTEYDAMRIVYNRFGSAVSFKPTIATVLSPDVSLCALVCMYHHSQPHHQYNLYWTWSQAVVLAAAL